MPKKLRLHTHPIMERKLNVPKGHVIIDAEEYHALMSQEYDVGFNGWLLKKEENESSEP